MIMARTRRPTAKGCALHFSCQLLPTSQQPSVDLTACTSRAGVWIILLVVHPIFTNTRVDTR